MYVYTRTCTCEYTQCTCTCTCERECEFGVRVYIDTSIYGVFKYSVRIQVQNYYGHLKLEVMICLHCNSDLQKATNGVLLTYQVTTLASAPNTLYTHTHLTINCYFYSYPLSLSLCVPDKDSVCPPTFLRRLTASMCDTSMSWISL